MRRGTLLFVLFVSVVAAFLWVFLSTAIAPGRCSHRVNERMLHDIKGGSKITEALKLLKSYGRPYMLLYKSSPAAAERATNEHALARLSYYSIQVSVVSEAPARGIVTESEILYLSFDRRGLFSVASCKKFYTGP